ncbi:hypothetical protein D9611_004837 [Ephemerocybe angulata]|uniref:Uncharacterized protein n=1 Tax=Ephemerocybe angulata TaxID=980116 RepID=A0A8H5B345_9AGAR|nr:hypothetical protein D9611_004837 [Tulosesus angulatus]
MAASPQHSPRAQTQQRTQGPGEAAIQHGADQLLALIDREKRIAVNQKDETIRQLAAQLHGYQQALSQTKSNHAAERSLQVRETQLLNEEVHRAKNGDSGVIDTLRRECESLRADCTATKGAVEQMGVYSVVPGFYSFAPQWIDLFNALGIEGGKPWSPEQLLAVIQAAAERLRQHRGDAPQPQQPLIENNNDPFVLQTELNRARAYVARLEELASKSPAPTPPTVPSQGIPPPAPTPSTY